MLRYRVFIAGKSFYFEKKLKFYWKERCSLLRDVTCIFSLLQERGNIQFSYLSLLISTRKSHVLRAILSCRKSWLLFRLRSFVTLIDNFVEGKNATKGSSWASRHSRSIFPRQVSTSTRSSQFLFATRFYATK